MKLFSNVRLVLLLLIGLAFGGGRAEAVTSGFRLSAYNFTTTDTTTNVYFTNNPVATVIFVTNYNAGFNLSFTYVTNAFSVPVTFLGPLTNDYSTNLFADVVSISTNADTVIYSVQNLSTNVVIEIAFAWQPLTTGPITNVIEVASSSYTNTASTNLVINQIYAASADLAVSNYFISQAYITNDCVVTNDWVTYGVTVANLGPGTAVGALLTNTLPPGAIVISANQSYTTAGATNLVFAVGTLTNGVSASFQFTIQPTTNGAFALTDTVGAPAVYDMNVINNAAVAALFVTNYLGTLGVGTTSAQTINQLSGVIEQTIGVTNTGGTTVPAVRVVISGLTTNQLYNASGTNNGQPFVVCPGSLAAGGRVGMRLQYAPRVPSPFNFVNSQLRAYVLPASVLNYTPPPATQPSASLNVYHVARLADGDMLLDFTNLGGSYTVVYSTNADFSQAMIATPAIISEASRITWLDYGPPETISAPTNSSQRFYRVTHNP